jgi:hypothetical protein
MPRRIAASVAFEAVLGEPVPLSDLERHKAALLTCGVYFLHEGIPTTFDPYSPSVVYIGKAIGETIFSRCRKHRAAISADPNVRPGKRFQAYCTATKGSFHNLYVVPGFMDSRKPYLISCAEEYLLHRYATRRGEKPRANTK